jgi:hypothetical protein
VNLAANKGVQLELPCDLIDAMFVDGETFSGLDFKPKTTKLFKRFVRAVRTAILAEVGAL